MKQQQQSGTPVRKSPPTPAEASKSKKIKISKVKTEILNDQISESSDDEFNISKIVEETVGNTNGNSNSGPSPRADSVQEFIDI